MICGHTNLGIAGLNRVKLSAFLQDFSETLVILLLLGVGNLQEGKGKTILSTIRRNLACS